MIDSWDDILDEWEQEAINYWEGLSDKEKEEKFIPLWQAIEELHL